VKYRWLGKKVEIPEIEKAIKSFLEQRRFSTASLEETDQKKIFGTLRDPESVKKVTITITGKTDDFTVDFFAGQAAQLATKFASFITFFGGGLIQLKSLKEKEFYDRLEEELWQHLDEFLGKTGSSNSSV